MLLDRRGDLRFLGRAHRCRRTRNRTGRFVCLDLGRARDAATSLGPGLESLFAQHNCGAGGVHSNRQLRSTPRCHLPDLPVSTAPRTTAPAALGTIRVDRPTSVLRHRGARGAGPVHRATRLRGTHSADRRTIDCADAARCLNGATRRLGKADISRGVVSAPPGSTNGRRDRRGRARTDTVDSAKQRFLSCATRVVGSDRTRLWASSVPSRLSAAAVPGSGSFARLPGS